MSRTRLTHAEEIEQCYDLVMMALADYLSRERDAEGTVGLLLHILDQIACGTPSPRFWSTQGCIRGRKWM